MAIISSLNINNSFILKLSSLLKISPYFKVAMNTFILTNNILHIILVFIGLFLIADTIISTIGTM